MYLTINGRYFAVEADTNVVLQIMGRHLARINDRLGPATLEHRPRRAVLLGGAPFGEEIVMWWNFIGRSHDEIVEFRNQWQEDVVLEGNPEGIFGHVEHSGSTIPAPEMPHVQLRPRKLPRP